MERSMRITLIGAALAVLLGDPAAAAESAPQERDGGIVAAIRAGKPIIDVRYRFEWKRQEGFAQDAHAHTIRTRLGYETGDLHGFRLLFEFENVADIGADHFNSTTNGLAGFPVIADPDATEINRAQLSFSAIPKTTATLGRQAFNLANQRFVGAVDFRQNQQTFDAARVMTTAIPRLTIDYLYIDKVRRIFGDDHPLGEFHSDSHVAAATFDARALGKLSGYGLVLDLDEAPALSSTTFGARYENALQARPNVKFAVVGEFASQRDHAANPFDYRATYWHGEGAATIKPATLRLGYERLGGNGVIGFATPLATLHKFQGHADVFLTTPPQGVADLYATLALDWNKAPFGAKASFFTTFHRFESALGAIDFGEEIDAGVSAVVAKHWTAEIKGAVYDGAGAFADRSLVWTSLRFQY